MILPLKPPDILLMMRGRRQKGRFEFPSVPNGGPHRSLAWP